MGGAAGELFVMWLSHFEDNTPIVWITFDFCIILNTCISVFWKVCVVYVICPFIMFSFF